MATDWNFKIPMLISSSGALKEARIIHNATDLLIDNDTGLTKFGNKTIYVLSIDFANKRIGINTTVPTSPIHIVDAASAVIKYERTGGALMFVSGTGSWGQLGTTTAHPFRVLVESASKFEIATTGIIKNLATYGHDMNGETIVPVQVNDSGEFGFDSSTLRIKTDIQDIPKSKADGIYSLRPVTYKPKKNLNKFRMGLIAEEVEPLFPEAVFYFIYKVVGGELVRPDISDYDEASWQDIKTKVKKDKETTIKVKKVKKRNKDGEVTETEEVDEVFTSVVEGINYNELISPMIAAINNLKAEVEALKAK